MQHDFCPGSTSAVRSLEWVWRNNIRGNIINYGSVKRRDTYNGLHWSHTTRTHNSKRGGGRTNKQDRQTDRQTHRRTDNAIYIYIYKSHCRCVCLSVCLFPLNLEGLKSHDHETWHVGPLSDLELHGPSGILIFGRVASRVRARHNFLFEVARSFFKVIVVLRS